MYTYIINAIDPAAQIALVTFLEFLRQHNCLGEGFGAVDRSEGKLSDGLGAIATVELHTRPPDDTPGSPNHFGDLKVKQPSLEITEVSVLEIVR